MMGKGEKVEVRRIESSALVQMLLLLIASLRKRIWTVGDRGWWKGQMGCSINLD